MTRAEREGDDGDGVGSPFAAKGERVKIKRENRCGNVDEDCGMAVCDGTADGRGPR